MIIVALGNLKFIYSIQKDQRIFETKKITTNLCIEIFVKSIIYFLLMKSMSVKFHLNRNFL